jgi:hypothetical protein
LTIDQRISLQKSLIDLIVRFGERGFAVSVDVKPFNNIMINNGFFNSAYAFCARCIIDEIGRWFYQTKFSGKSAFFFENGHESRSEADRLISGLLTNPFNKVSGLNYGYVAHGFVEKAESPPVQAADILAWQWAKNVKERVSDRPRRKDFEAMLRIPHVFYHFDEAKLRNFLKTFSALRPPSNFEELPINEQVAFIRRVSGFRAVGLRLSPNEE